ncbi:MAG: DUF4347 domain-containing protein [Cyanobacteria bacterium J06634_5]
MNTFSSVHSPTGFLPKVLSFKSLTEKTSSLARPLSGTRVGRGMLVVIDESVEHGDALAAGVIRGAKLLVLESKRCAIAQITEAIGRFPGKFESLHIVTHGSPGCLHFSSGDITFANLHTFAESIESWFSYQTLKKGSKIKVKDAGSFLSLYACNLATGEAGLELLEKLHFLTGVSVHASRGKVGSTTLNGSWQLETTYPFACEAKFPFTDDLLETYKAVA